MEMMKRAIHLDFHTMPGIYDFEETFDAKAFAQTLKDAKVEYLNAVAQCNLGHCYYPTNVGVRYPGLKTDLFGDMVRECNKVGIKVIGYVSTGLNHEQSRRHPEWCNMNADGQIIYGDRTANFFRTVCYNTGYADHILAIFKELLENYDLDGLFLDNTSVRACYCPTCTEKMLKAGIDINDPEAVKNFAFESLLKFREKILAILPEGKRLKMNGLGHQFCTHGEIECLPTGSWGYEFFGSACAMVRNMQKDVIYMTGRFQRSWGDFGGLRTEVSVENDMFDALLNNAQISVGDHMHPRGGLDPAVYKMVKNLFTKMERYEPWTDNARYLPEIGVLLHWQNYMAPSYYGIGRMLGELKYNYDFVGEDADFSRFRVMILPDIVTVTKPLAEKLSAYLAQGGKLLVSGGSALNPEKTGFALKELDFVDFVGVDNTKTAYYQPLGDSSDGLPVRSMYESGILMTAKNPDDVSAKYVKPYFDRHWDGEHGYYYTPPTKEAPYDAVVGHGAIQLISFDVFASYNQYASVFHKKLVKDCLEKLLPDNNIKAEELPSYARATLTGTDAYNLLHVKVTYPEARGGASAIEEHNILPAGRKIKVKGNYKKVMLLPEQTELAFQTDNGYVEFTLPEITGYQMFCLEK